MIRERTNKYNYIFLLGIILGDALGIRLGEI